MIPLLWSGAYLAVGVVVIVLALRLFRSTFMYSENGWILEELHRELDHVTLYGFYAKDVDAGEIRKKIAEAEATTSYSVDGDSIGFLLLSGAAWPLAILVGLFVLVIRATVRAENKKVSVQAELRSELAAAKKEIDDLLAGVK